MLLFRLKILDKCVTYRNKDGPAKRLLIVYVVRGAVSIGYKINYATGGN